MITATVMINAAVDRIREVAQAVTGLDNVMGRAASQFGEPATAMVGPACGRCVYAATRSDPSARTGGGRSERWQPRVTGVRHGAPLLRRRPRPVRRRSARCAGFRPDYFVAALEVLHGSGRLRHRGGNVEAQPGLHAVDLSYQRSATLHSSAGVATDARHITDDHRRDQRPAEGSLAGHRAAAAGTARTSP